MLLELMDFIKGFVASNEQFEKLDLSNLVFICSLLCNLVHRALLSRYFFNCHLLACIYVLVYHWYNAYIYKKNLDQMRLSIISL